MFPNNELSNPTVYSQFQFPRNIPVLPPTIESREMGGIALNDPSQGLLVQPWRAFLDGNNIYVEAPVVPATFLFSGVGITSISLAFDQNMRANIAYVQLGVSKLWWYDTAIPGHTITTLATGTGNPVISLDDHRSFANAYNDIILSYIRDGNFYMRLQRDRYTIEYLLYPDINLVLANPDVHNTGMNIGTRFQFEVRGYPFGR